MTSSKKYNKFLSVALGTLLVTSTIAPVVPNNLLTVKAAAALSDVEPGTYYYEAVNELIDQKVIGGFPDGTFKPYQGTTRGQAAVMIAGALKLDGKNATDPGFTDVSNLSYYYDEVAALVEEKIIDGVTEQAFEPDRIVTRAEMAKMIVNAFDLKENKDRSSKFTDIPTNSWYAGFVKTLLDNDVTNGVTDTTFGPGGEVQRAQVATFIHRAQQKTNVIETVTDSAVVINGKSYNLAENVKSIFNSANAPVLKNAFIQFEEYNGKITSIKSLEITENGQAPASGQSQQSGHLVLDGKNTVIDGSVTINGDYITVKNLTIKENFTIGTGVQNSFLMDHVSVEGTTTVDDTDIRTASISNETSMKAAAAMKVKIIFSNSTLKKVAVNKNDVAVQSTGTTTLLEMQVSSNASISADSTVVIPKITLQMGSQEVEINAAVKELVVDSKDEITITGEAAFETVKVSTDKTVNLNTTGEIKQLEATNTNVNITLSKETTVGSLIVPEGTEVSNIIDNYKEVKDNINDVTTPDGGEIPPVTTPVGGQPGETPGTGSTPIESVELEITDAYLYTKKGQSIEGKIVKGESVDTITFDLSILLDEDIIGSGSMYVSTKSRLTVYNVPLHKDSDFQPQDLNPVVENRLNFIDQIFDNVLDGDSSNNDMDDLRDFQSIFDSDMIFDIDGKLVDESNPAKTKQLKLVFKMGGHKS